MLVVEDDHLGPVAGTPWHTLADGRRRWATVRSVSKWLGPDLRLALVAGDDTTLARVEGRQSLGPGWVSGIVQRLAARLWADPDVMAGVAAAAQTYAERRAALAALRRRRVRRRAASTSGSRCRTRTAAVRALLADGWAVAAGRPYRLSGGPAIRITTAGRRSRRRAGSRAAHSRAGG